MKLLIPLLIVFGSFNNALAQNNVGLCKVQIADVSKMTGFGYLVGYTVQFKNNSRKTVDGIYWTVYYYNNDNKLIEYETDSFNSTNLIDPIAAGFTKSIVRKSGIKGASKMSVIINKVHYSDGSSCN